jgi:hypothetical protein
LSVHDVLAQKSVHDVVALNKYWLDVIEAEGKLKPGQLKPSDIYTHEYNSFYK